MYKARERCIYRSISTKIQSNVMKRIEATSADNVLMAVDSSVIWRITDVAVAAKNSAWPLAAAPAVRVGLRRMVGPRIAIVHHSGSRHAQAHRLALPRNRLSCPRRPHRSVTIIASTTLTACMHSGTGAETISNSGGDEFGGDSGGDLLDITKVLYMYRSTHRRLTAMTTSVFSCATMC